MTSPVRPFRVTLPEAIFVACAAIVVVDIIAIIALVSDKRYTVVYAFNPVSWITAPVTSTTYGWILVPVLTVVAALLYFTGKRLKRRRSRR
jgi:hypothetical protein